MAASWTPHFGQVMIASRALAMQDCTASEDESDARVTDSTTYPRKERPPSRPSCPLVAGGTPPPDGLPPPPRASAPLDFLCTSSFILPPATPLTYRPFVSMEMHSNAVSAILWVLDSDEMTMHRAWRVVITAGCMGSIAAASTFAVRGLGFGLILALFRSRLSFLEPSSAAAVSGGTGGAWGRVSVDVSSETMDSNRSIAVAFFFSSSSIGSSSLSSPPSFSTASSPT
mmetsp:Transcript_14486/g.34932  ORF Transcript_14486/g.34932 Transcript_14486/m.34932 type:complete len:228 (+) Transcript_14486:90-773(+)